MRDDGMPWAAVDYAKRPDMAALNKYAGNGIPDLVIVDGSGRVLSDSFVNGKYVGPAHVLAELDEIFAKTSASALATR